jgi:hypothetical protein
MLWFDSAVKVGHPKQLKNPKSLFCGISDLESFWVWHSGMRSGYNRRSTLQQELFEPTWKQSAQESKAEDRDSSAECER